MMRPILALICCCACAPARAEQPTTTLSLDEALASAIDLSPLVRRALRERAVVAAGRVAASVPLPANPVVTVTAGARRDRSTSTPASAGAEVGARLEQMIEVGGQRGLRRAEVDRAIAGAELRVALARAETRARVQAGYVAALLAQRHLDNAREQEALGEQVFESARIRFDAGAGTEVDRNLADVERARLGQERVSASLALAEANDRLARIVGLPAGSALALGTALDLPPSTLDPLETSLARARTHRLELRLLDAGRSQLDAALLRLRRERVPSPTLFIDVASQQPGQLYLGGGVALPLPLWRRGQGEIAALEASRALVEEERAIAAEQVELEVRQAHRAARELRSAVERWRAGALPAAERNLALVSQGWRSGKFDLFRVVHTAREAAETRRRVLELTGALWDATITLERVTGGRP